ncbi:hypothetical protein [Micromonospora sp. NPDC004704]
MANGDEPKMGWRLFAGFVAATELPGRFAEGGWHAKVIGSLLALVVGIALRDLFGLLLRMVRRLRKRMAERRILFVIPEPPTPQPPKDRTRRLG